MRYLLASRREEPVTVDGLGVLQPGVVKEVTDDEAALFFLGRGLTLAQAGLPEGVEVGVFIGNPDAKAVEETGTDENTEEGVS